MKISELKPNPNNPRIIKDDKFNKLVKSISEFPEMMEKRPIVVVTDVDSKMFPLGGNMRLKALQHLNYKEVPDNWIIKADDWTEEKRREFVIKDNIGFGDWDWEDLSTNWDTEQLEDWGLDVHNNVNLGEIDLDKFFEEDNIEKENKFKIILEYTEEDFNAVQEALKKHSGSKEEIFFKLLGL